MRSKTKNKARLSTRKKLNQKTAKLKNNLQLRFFNLRSQDRKPKTKAVKKQRK